MALLLQHVGLRLPLPHQQLAQVGAAQGDPVAGGVEANGGNGVVGDGEAVDQGGVGQTEEQEGAAVKARHQDFGLLVEVRAGEGDPPAPFLYMVPRQDI